MAVLMVYFMGCHWEKKMELYWDIQLESKYGKLDGGIDGEVNILVI